MKTRQRFGVAYKIENAINGKKYIGVTVNWEKVRKPRHLLDLFRGKHHSLKLQRAFDKYGLFCFNFEIIEENIPVEKLFSREIELISQHNSFKAGYNMNGGGLGAGIGNTNGKSCLGKERFGNRVKSVFYNYKTGEVYFFDKMTDCVKIGLTSSGAVCDAMNEKTRYVNEWLVFKESDFCIKNLKKKFLALEKRNKNFGRKRPKEIGEAISRRRVGMKFSESHIRNMSLCRMGKGEGVIRSDGKTYGSMGEAARDLRCDPSSISHNIRGKRKTIHGYTFKKINNHVDLTPKYP